MKKFAFVFVLFVLCVFGLSACGRADNSRYLRIHIRADSNAPEAQSVKYVIKEKLVSYLTPILSECENKGEAVKAVNSRLSEITRICDAVLLEKGFAYKSSAKVKSELFPVRSYGEYVFEEGIYDALVIELGSAQGDNWWCMVYPPLCFTGGEANGSGEITYKSKILEIIEEFKQKYLS